MCLLPKQFTKAICPAGQVKFRNGLRELGLWLARMREACTTSVPKFINTSCEFVHPPVRTTPVSSPYVASLCSHNNCRARARFAPAGFPWQPAGCGHFRRPRSPGSSNRATWCDKIKPARRGIGRCGRTRPGRLDRHKSGRGLTSVDRTRYQRAPAPLTYPSLHAPIRSHEMSSI